MKTKLKLWVFWYNSNTWESSSFPMSYHRTIAGAREAMKFHKEEKRYEHYKHVESQKNWNRNNGFKENLGISKFGAYESWKVEKFDLEILE